MTPTEVPDKIFPITTFISDLPTNLILQPLSPFSENDPTRGRLVIVGDVHGMRQSLEALLDKVGFDKSKGDHLILVGDLISKGPDSPGVIDLAMKLGASAVRGNHENAVLNAAAEMNVKGDILPHSGDLTGSTAVPENAQVNLTENTVSDSEAPDKCASAATGNGMRASSATQSTALAISKCHLDWLAALPCILRIKLPHNLVSSLGDTLIVVHAGLVPGIPLEEQNPHAIMHMRSFVPPTGDEDGFIPAEISGEEGWVVEWDRWQDRLPSKTTVVFGHDAKRRLQVGRYTIGLDSACLYGHLLSALVIAAPDGQIEHQVVQVECTDAPVVPTGDKPVVG